MRCIICGYPLLQDSYPSECAHPNAPHMNDVESGHRVQRERPKKDESVKAESEEEKKKKNSSDDKGDKADPPAPDPKHARRSGK